MSACEYAQGSEPPGKKRKGNGLMHNKYKSVCYHEREILRDTYTDIMQQEYTKK